MFNVNNIEPVKKINLTPFKLTIKNKVARAVWNIIWLILYRPSPILFHGWRRFLLRSFGAKMGKRSLPYPSAKIWAPWNLTMSDDSCLSHYVDCYCVDQIFLGSRVTVSQYTYLCTASHDYTQRSMPLIRAPIRIESDAWITADVFIGPGVTIGEGAVVGARSTITRNVSPWTIVAGSPPKVIGPRHFN